jgi:hypothetical protein
VTSSRVGETAGLIDGHDRSGRIGFAYDFTPRFKNLVRRIR